MRSIIASTLLAVGVIALDAALMAAPAVQPPEQQIEITVRNSTFLKTRTMPIRPELPVSIVIRNEDDTNHGFVSPMLTGLAVNGHADGVEFFGRGIDGVHVGPRKAVVLRMVVPAQGTFTFRCDLHGDMQGEVYLLDVLVA